MAKPLQERTPAEGLLGVKGRGWGASSCQRQLRLGDRLQKVIVVSICSRCYEYVCVCIDQIFLFSSLPPLLPCDTDELIVAHCLSQCKHGTSAEEQASRQDLLSAPGGGVSTCDSCVRSGTWRVTAGEGDAEGPSGGGAGWDSPFGRQAGCAPVVSDSSVHLGAAGSVNGIQVPEPV